MGYILQVIVVVLSPTNQPYPVKGKSDGDTYSLII